MIFDSDQNITRLQDVNLAATETFGVEGISTDHPGGMTWYTAQDWIAAMNEADYKGYNDWRLPATVNGDWVL